MSFLDRQQTYMGHCSNSSINIGRTPGSELQSPGVWDWPAFTEVNKNFSTDFAALINPVAAEKVSSVDFY